MDSTISHPELKGLPHPWGRQTSGADATTASQPQVGLQSATIHRPLDIMFTILANTLALERSVVAKSHSTSEKSEWDVGASPCGSPCCVVRALGVSVGEQPVLRE